MQGVMNFTPHFVCSRNEGNSLRCLFLALWCQTLIFVCVQVSEQYCFSLRFHRQSCLVSSFIFCVAFSVLLWGRVTSVERHYENLCLTKSWKYKTHSARFLGGVSQLQYVIQTPFLKSAFCVFFRATKHHTMTWYQHSEVDLIAKRIC